LSISPSFASVRSSFKAGDRFFPTFYYPPYPLPKIKTMTTYLSISIPVYTKDRWDRTEQNGKLEVSSDVDSLSVGYEELKQQLDILLADLDAQNRLAESALVLENEIQQKAHRLKKLTEDIDRATQHYKTLQVFLEVLGIDPKTPRFTFDEKLILSAAVTEIEQTLQQNYGEF
jgi:hypothetical protein